MSKFSGIIFLRELVFFIEPVLELVLEFVLEPEPARGLEGVFASRFIASEQTIGFEINDKYQRRQNVSNNRGNFPAAFLG